MRQSRSRTGRGTVILAAVVCIGFLYFFLGPSSADRTKDSVRRRLSQAAAANPLSPPTSAFRKQPQGKSNGKRVPPPVVHYQLNNLTASAQPVENKERVLILTPLARFYQEYWDNLFQLNYPHELISLGFIIPKTRDGNAATTALQTAVSSTQSGPEEQRFQSVTILRQDFTPPLTSQDEAERHKMSNQRDRRSSMARARNSLLFTTLGPSTSWILWLDGDIVETPPDMIQTLASFDKPIIVPNCYQRYLNPETGRDDVRPYDYNSWQDSETAHELARGMKADDILLEGYAEMPTYRTLLAHVAEKGKEADTRKLIRLDGVGGTALLVKAEVHRDGAMFPPFPFYHLIETEGFAKMAKRLGWESWGLPNYFVSTSPNLRRKPWLIQSSAGVSLQRVAAHLPLIGSGREHVLATRALIARPFVNFFLEIFFTRTSKVDRLGTLFRWRRGWGRGYTHLALESMSCARSRYMDCRDWGPQEGARSKSVQAAFRTPWSRALVRIYLRS